MKTLRRLLPFILERRPLLMLAYACMVLMNLGTVLYAALAGPAIQFVFSGNMRDVLRQSDGTLRPALQLLSSNTVTSLEALEPQSALYILPGFIICVAILKGVGQLGQFFLFGKISQHVLHQVRTKAFASLLSQPPQFFSRHNQGDLLSRITSDAQLIEQAVFNGFRSLLLDSLALVGLVGYLFYSDPKLALWTFITIPLAVIPLVRFTSWLKKVVRRGQNAAGEISSTAYEALSGVRVVQTFSNESGEEERFSAASLSYHQQMLRSYFIRAARTPTMEILGAVGLAAMIAFVGDYVQNHDVDRAHYVSFLGAIFFMYDPLKRLGRVGDYLAAGSAAADRVFEIIDTTPAIITRLGAKELPLFSNVISFTSVSFSYADAPACAVSKSSHATVLPQTGAKVLDDVSLHINKGELVALVGASGSGKSTMANLLPRFYDVQGGAITIDGHDIKDITLSSLRNAIAFVGQETFLFDDTIAANIAYGADDPTVDDIEDAAQAAYADEFIEALSKGYDTVVGERGMMLSGGQRQRIAIARALLKNAPILILDEATSALDVESEAYVQQALEYLMKGRTSLVIAHRLSTIRKADLICVLKEGKIVERGNHQQLIQRRGEYARLHRLQFKDALQDEAQTLTASPARRD